MPTLSTMSAAKTKRVLLYGAPKTGKSLLAGKLAARFKLIWIDLEKGKDVLFQLPPEQQARIQVITVPDTKDTPMASETLLKILSGKEVKICWKHGKVACPLCAKSAPEEFDTVNLGAIGPDTVVVVDSLTQFTISSLNNLIRNKPDDYKPLLDDWGNLKVIIEKAGSFIQAANYNIVCISHEDSVEMVDGKEKIVPVFGSRNASRNSAKYFDEVVFCEVYNGKHKFASSTTYKPSVLTGSRHGKVMEKEAEPSLLDLWD